MRSLLTDVLAGLLGSVVNELRKQQEKHDDRIGDLALTNLRLVREVEAMKKELAEMKRGKQ